MLGKAFSSRGGAPKVPVQVRRQKLADAEQKFGSMFPRVGCGTTLSTSMVAHEHSRSSPCPAFVEHADRAPVNQCRVLQFRVPAGV